MADASAPAQRTVTPQDRDLMIRTVIGEAGNQPDLGQAAVAHVITNRWLNGGWGDNIANVVTANDGRTWQFEPWGSRAGELKAIDPNSPRYQAVAKVVDGVLSGDTPDPTSGALNFLNPATVSQRRGGSLPSWANGAGVQIGAHVFVNGKPSPAGDAIQAAAPAEPPSQAPTAYTQAPASKGPTMDYANAPADDLLELAAGRSPGAASPKLASKARPAWMPAWADPNTPQTEQPTGGPDYQSMSTEDLLGLVRGQPSPSTGQSGAAPSTTSAGPQDQAPPLTIRGGNRPAQASPAGPLSNSPDDTALTSSLKNVATGAIKGVGDAIGFVGNTGNLADYLVAGGEHLFTGQPVGDIMASIAQDKQRQAQSPTPLGKLAALTDPRAVMPSGQDVSNPLLAAAGQYEPTSELGRLAQVGVQTAFGAAGPGVRGTATGAAVPGILSGAVRGAPGAAIGGATSQGVTDATGNPLLGLLAAAGPAIVAGGANRLTNKLIGTTSSETAALGDIARNGYSIPVTAGQMSDSPAMRFANSTVNRLPFSGAGPAAAEQQTAFNRAVAQQFGEDADKITPQVMQAAKARLGQAFEDVAAKTNITGTQALGGDLRTVMNDAMQVLPDADLRPLAAQVYNITDVIRQNNGTIPGASYQALTRKGTPLDRAMASGNPNVSYYARQIKDALDDALQASAPPGVVDQLSAARSQYKVLKTIEPLVEKSTTGDISPAGLMGAVRGSFGTMAYNGGGPMGDLARIGQKFLKEPPSSGTAERTGAMNMLSQLAGAGASAAGIGLGAYADLSPMTALGTAVGVPLTLAAGRGVRSFLGSDGAANRLIAASLGRQQGPGVGQKLLNALAIPALDHAGSHELLRRAR